MRLESLRKQVLEANLELVRRGLVIETFGNASGCDRTEGLVVIKPSGVPYDQLRPEAMVVTDLRGKVVEGDLRPSSDLPTHLVLYRELPGIGGVVHTHSRFATIWAQARREIPCFGTTHADYFPGSVPLTREMMPREIEVDYEYTTGQIIVNCLDGQDPLLMKAVLVASHGPFCWGKEVDEAVAAAAILEEIAHLAYCTATLNPGVGPVSKSLLNKHFTRKHGPRAYYGQTKPTDR